MRYDLHVHSHFSKCSNLSIKNILKKSEEKGLDGIAVTDHNTIKGGREAYKLNKNKNLEVIVGEEIMTDKGEVIGIYLNKEIKPGRFERVIEDIKKQNGIAIIAHPFSIGLIGRKKADEKIFKSVDAVEGFNSRAFLKRYNYRGQKYAKRFNLPIVGGSDAHLGFEIGRSVTKFNHSLRKAISKKETKVHGENNLALPSRLISLGIMIYKKITKYFYSS